MQALPNITTTLLTVTDQLGRDMLVKPKGAASILQDGEVQAPSTIIR